MTSISSPLSSENKKIVTDCLQGALIDLIDLSLEGKQAHWNVIGRHFRSIHLHLDEIVDLARESADLVAEREVALGSNPDGRPGTVARDSHVTRVDSGYIEDGKVIAIFTDVLESIIRRMRERVDATETTDPVTQDLLIGITRDLEKHHWMMQAQR
ncbi:DNA starvation/stationary phase protection protein [Microtetraspora sp. AC03309]|uniref:Dps family protein n=1 Tax=Microtetraspora sp. AC03309 TaxID=2779376 RepID=UPI001E5B65ED|nr:DNA starvation/stationary phase protection protein [Microtetraspora sp. AC03309]MCC5578236.1 DNA starvation/stationary phase protection protein [Microtetraspora sp. AC03309]